MTFAVIRTGGKQYVAEAGTKLKIDKLEGAVGDAVTFADVLLSGEDDKIKVGFPLVSGVVVEAKIVKQGKEKKVWGMKHNAKKRYKLKFGHRQQMTHVEITKVA
ncbi:50S ribosomal protein L21 [Patescibacteria group bacterium]|nr:MAG: 50S ribosomal protein L21 [Patescibacteria group bacterium]